MVFRTPTASREDRREELHVSLIEKVTVPVGRRGRWRVSRFTVSKVDSERSLLRSAMKGRGYVPEGTYTSLTCEGRGIVMSDTPDEMLDNYSAVYRAKDLVLINGLGLGMVLGAVLRKPEVGHVTVVEIDPDVIELVGPHYGCDRLTIINDDAFQYMPTKGVRFAAVWHDIWDDICTDNLPEMTKLKRRYGRRTDWQGCWSGWQARRIAV